MLSAWTSRLRSRLILTAALAVLPALLVVVYAQVRDVAPTTWWLALVALAALATCGVGVELFVLRPVRRLGRVTRRLAGGDLAARADLTRGVPGLAELGEAFNEMATALEARYVEHAQLEARLRQSQKMEALGRLAGGVAHDFNNLLTALLGFTALALEDLDARHPARTDVEAIQSAGESAAALTRQLLAFSRSQVIQPRVLDLNRVVTRIEGLLRRVIGEDVKLVVNLDRSLVAVTADPGVIEQIIVNLAVNGRDAMPMGGRLTIETTNADLDETFVADRPGSTVGPHAVLRMSDDGIGMAPDVLPRIFEPFFTTKQLGRGTGLGLATVYGLAKQSGGYIQVESGPDRGSVFSVYLPRASAPAEEEIVPPPEGVSARGSETILVVEDQPAVRALVCSTLTQQGYTVLDAGHGQDALTLLDEQTDGIDLLVTDVVMPGMSGRELATSVRALRPQVRVLYMSGYAPDAALPAEIINSGAAFLPKPFVPATLLRKVRELLDSTSLPQPYA